PQPTHFSPLSLHDALPIFVSVQGRHVERHTEARLSVRDQILEPPVRVLRAPIAGEHPHRPQATSVHRRMDPAGVREPTRLPEALDRKSTRLNSSHDQISYA